jgi:hypothetical protein
VDKSKTDNFFKLFDSVVLNRKLDNIPEGTNAVIVHDFERGGMYCVECFNEKHETIGVITVHKNDLKKSDKK